MINSAYIKHQGVCVFWKHRSFYITANNIFGGNSLSWHPGGTSHSHWSQLVVWAGASLCSLDFMAQWALQDWVTSLPSSAPNHHSMQTAFISSLRSSIDSRSLEELMANSRGDGSGWEHACVKHHEHCMNRVCVYGKTTSWSESIVRNTARADQTPG